MIVCLFDIDGTLLSSGGAGKAAMENALELAFGVPCAFGNIAFSGRTDRAIGQDLFRLHAIEESERNWRRFLEAYLHLLPGYLAKFKGQVLPGIASLLQSLQSRPDVTVGLLTGNIRDGARLKLDHYGLFHHFGFGGFGDHHLNRDDVAWEALAAVQKHLPIPVDLGKVWVIGDTPLDVRCARSIGVKVLAVATGWHSEEILAAEQPDLLLPDLTDPAPLLERWHC
jgi:phosphoglycolate phosphatase-like HAD superfamily hydrolase